MIKKKLNKLVGLKKERFDFFVESKQIQVQSARLIPTLKTGDEMALTSIFLATIKLVKEYRNTIFKDLKLKRGGKAYYYTEASFPDIDKSRIDGLIIIVSKGVIVDAAFFEMKNKNNGLNKEQVEKYVEIAKKLRVGKLVTISNEFVADFSHSPVKVKTPKSVSLSHFSWTYLITKGQLLLFKNDANIKDEDQVSIMRETLYYFENPISGISGYTQMKAGWKELAENIRAQKPLKLSEDYIEDAVLSWYEEEKDLALLLSRKLGVLVKSSSKTKTCIKEDIKKLVKENYIVGSLAVKNSVSDIKIKAEFERRVVSMSVKVIPPMDKGTTARISWIGRQLDYCSKKSESKYNKLESNIWLEANVKFAQKNEKIKLSNLESLNELVKGKEVQAFHIVYIKELGVGFASNTKIIKILEEMIVDYYEGIVQNVANWNRPAPRLD